MSPDHISPVTSPDSSKTVSILTVTHIFYIVQRKAYRNLDLSVKYHLILCFSFQFPHDSDTSGGSFLADLMEEDEYECDDDDIYLTSPISQLPLHSTLSDSQFLENFQYSSQLYHEDKEVMPYSSNVANLHADLYIH